MSALINSVEHALAVAASDTVKVAKFVETSVLPALKTAQANEATIESITSLVSPQAANIERACLFAIGRPFAARERNNVVVHAMRPYLNLARHF